MRRQPYCAKTPTTHQFIGGEETECWSQSVYGDDLEAMVVRSQWGNLARMSGLHPYSFSKDISFMNGSISFGMLLFCTQRRRSHFFSPRPHAYLPCFVPLSRIERLSLHCSPNWKIMDLTNWSFNAIDTIFGFRGTWLPRRNVRSGLYDGRVGEVANRVSCGSFCGGHWRYLPIRNHDNRYFADYIGDQNGQRV